MLLSQSAALHRPAASRNRPGKPGIKVVKHSPISTGQLRRLPALHSQPINLVVFQGALGRKVQRNLILGMASRLDAFSAYPSRTLATLRCHERDNRNTRGTSL